MKIIVGKNYIFMVYFSDIHLAFDVIHDRCKEIDYRVDEISKILNIDTPLYSIKTKYFIKHSTNTLGKFQKNLIYCESPHWDNLYEPFVHEECHDITFRKWGILPCFLFEGIAEYVLFSSERKDPSVFDFAISCQEKCKKELQKRKDNLLSNTDKNQIPFFKYTYFYRAGRSFITSIINNFSMEALHHLFALFNDNYVLYLEVISEYYDTWVNQYLGEKNEKSFFDCR